VAPPVSVCELLEKLAPSTAVLPAVVELPSIWQPEKLAHRMLTIKRRKMKKFKAEKRYKRDFFKIQTYERKQKAIAEELFRNRMALILGELKTFDAEVYAVDVIKRAKREWSEELAPTGRQLYPHWSTLMSIEELYGLEPDDYIDKRSGWPDAEDEQRIRELKEDYAARFRLKNDDGDKA